MLTACSLNPGANGCSPDDLGELEFSVIEASDTPLYLPPISSHVAHLRAHSPGVDPQHHLVAQLRGARAALVCPGCCDQWKLRQRAARRPAADVPRDGAERVTRRRLLRLAGRPDRRRGGHLVRPPPERAAARRFVRIRFPWKAGALRCLLRPGAFRGFVRMGSRAQPRFHSPPPPPSFQFRPSCCPV